MPSTQNVILIFMIVMLVTVLYYHRRVACGDKEPVRPDSSFSFKETAPICRDLPANISGISDLSAIEQNLEMRYIGHGYFVSKNADDRCALCVQINGGKYVQLINNETVAGIQKVCNDLGINTFIGDAFRGQHNIVYVKHQDVLMSAPEPYLSAIHTKQYNLGNADNEQLMINRDSIFDTDVLSRYTDRSVLKQYVI